MLLQMNLCEQETATAVQDLEVRQMELEIQRRRLEQVTKTETFGEKQLEQRS